MQFDEFFHATRNWTTRLRDWRGTIIATHRSYYHVRRKNGIILAKGVTISPSFRFTDHFSSSWHSSVAWTTVYTYVSIATRIDFIERSKIHPVIFYVTNRCVSFYSNIVYSKQVNWMLFIKLASRCLYLIKRLLLLLPTRQYAMMINGPR